MSAEDDYPALAVLHDAWAASHGTKAPEAVRAFIEIVRLRRENKAWMNGVADAVEPLGYDREAACGPADLLPGLDTLRALSVAPPTTTPTYQVPSFTIVGDASVASSAPTPPTDCPYCAMVAPLQCAQHFVAGSAPKEPQ